MAVKSPSRIDVSRYLELVRGFPLVPIHNDKQLESALAEIDSLLDKDRNPEEEAVLGVLTALVKRYEDDRYPPEPVSDDVMLADLLESRGMSQAELSRRSGLAESAISFVLSGARKLTRRQIGKVCAVFKVSPAVFEFRA